ncbi:hypothetical protein [Pseudoroseomonas cervicalis]|uniref:hypothetical protein n=1 Tax=Teichococcus cervicalis TaxID=204525 RepID=UPI0022F17A25|nr:hypothetical protein [Pseudoroseomonas cervicalis]WBV42522.1 hypothetical protein PFY06_14930 [Pseudoroseomonas cervicalis]
MDSVQQHGGQHPSVYEILRQNPPAEGFPEHAAFRLFEEPARPFRTTLNEGALALARRIADNAPPRILNSLIASIRLPRSVALVELPGGEAIYAEVEDGRLCVCVLRTDGVSVSAQPVAALVRLPSRRPRIDWRVVRAETWAPNARADAKWVAWSDEDFDVVPVRGAVLLTPVEKFHLHFASVVPSLVALALATDPVKGFQREAWDEVYAIVAEELMRRASRNQVGRSTLGQDAAGRAALTP